LDELAKDIKTHGLAQPIALWTDPSGKTFLLDGRNRCEALERAGLPETRVELPADTDPWSYVISVNVRRRHLTTEQKRAIIAKVLKANPERSDRETANLVKADHKTVGSVRRQLESTGEVPQLAKTTGKDGRHRPARQPKPPART